MSMSMSMSVRMAGLLAGLILVVAAQAAPAAAPRPAWGDLPAVKQLAKTGLPLTLAAVVKPVPASRNAAPLLRQAAPDLRKMREELGAAGDRPAAVRQVLARHGQTLGLLRQAADRPALQALSPADLTRWSPQLGGSDLYAAVRAGVHALGRSAVSAAEQKDRRRAYADAKAALQLANLMYQDSLLMGQLVAIAGTHIASDSLAEVLRALPPTKAEAVALLPALDPTPARQGAVLATKGEVARAIMALRYDYERGQPALTPAQVGERLKQLVASWPQRQAIAGMACRELRQVKPAGANGELIAATVRARQATDRAVTELALGRWALALGVYRARTGRYPATLSEASRELGKALPMDPCSGRLPIYRRVGAGYTLYGVGPDGADNRGDDRQDVVWP